MKHTMVDRSSPTCVYSHTSSAQVMTFPKSNLISSEALYLCRTAIIINLKKNPTSLSNHHHHQPFLKTHLWNFECSKNLCSWKFLLAKISTALKISTIGISAAFKISATQIYAALKISAIQISAAFKISKMGF